MAGRLPCTGEHLRLPAYATDTCCYANSLLPCRAWDYAGAVTAVIFFILVVMLGGFFIINL